MSSASSFGWPKCSPLCIRETFLVLGLQVRLRQPRAKEKRLAGNTDVDVSIEVAVDTLGACDSFDQVLTCCWAPACHSPADALVLAANKIASSITSVS